MTARSRTQLFWSIQIGSWLLLIPLFVYIALLVYGDWRNALFVGGLRQCFSFVLTLGLWRCYRRWPTAGFRIAPHAAKILGLCILASGIDVALTEATRLILEMPEPSPLIARGTFFVRCLLYIAWSTLYFAIRQELDTRETALRLARAESANREAELHLLRAQINPHFLLNALSTIIDKAEHEPAAVADTTHAVADYLRYSLRQNSHFAPLGGELDAMANYLRIEEANHAVNRFVWTIEASPEARAASAPTALVQPLVENALKYGLRSSPPPLRLNITAQVRDTVLLVAVENTGAWIERAPGEVAPESTGIGLNNIRRRLAILCGQGAKLEVEPREGFVRVTAVVPLRPPARSSA